MAADLAPGVVPIAEANRAALAVDGVMPRYVVAPADAAETAQVVGWAMVDRIAVIPRGGGSRIGLANLPRAYDLALSTGRLNRLVEYEPADLTVTVQAGMPFADLQGALRAHGQFLPLDPPLAPGSTIGGMVASNASGPFRLRYGTARDLVIGTEVATTSGRLARAGGKVVKNVTGYDLNKLYIGSLGSLAVLTELTFKVQPLPERETTLLLRFRDWASAGRTVYRVLRSPLTPSALELSRIAVDDVPQIGLHVHVGGFAPPLQRTIEDLIRYGQEEGAIGAAELDAASAADAWTTLRQGPRGEGCRLKIAVPIGQVTAAIDAVETAAEASALSAQVMASAGVGVIRVGLEVSGSRDGAAGRILAAIRRLRLMARERLGSVAVESCPLELKRDLDVLGEPGDSQEIVRRLKLALDPSGVMSPGRFLGRL